MREGWVRAEDPESSKPDSFTFAPSTTAAHSLSEESAAGEKGAVKLLPLALSGVVVEREQVG